MKTKIYRRIFTIHTDFTGFKHVLKIQEILDHSFALSIFDL